MSNPVVVVPAFNRPGPLARLLSSLSVAFYPDDDVHLVISIDFSDSQSDVRHIADEFSWLFGEKRVILHDRHMGLRSHILFCGDLSESYGGVILLEDDLFVSPFFYLYAVEASQAYRNDSNIAGISLYAHSHNETAMLAFMPYEDGYDNYFLQLPSSWGQCWFYDQWQRFREWYDVYHSMDLSKDETLPVDVVKWPESSWKKYFIRYMMSTGQYFAYPRVSLTTNFMDPGTHHKNVHDHLQVPLQAKETNYRFSSMAGSSAIYDAFCEPVPAVLNRLSSKLSGFSNDYVVDLYGVKPLKRNTMSFALTSRPCQSPVFRWGRRLKPHEKNLYLDMEGDELSLVAIEDVNQETKRDFFPSANYYQSLSPQFYQIGINQYEAWIIGYREELARCKESLASTHKIIAERERQLSDTKESLSMNKELLKASDKALNDSNNALNASNNALNASNNALNAVLQSTSWKITGPMRRFLLFVRKLKGEV